MGFYHKRRGESLMEIRTNVVDITTTPLRNNAMLVEAYGDLDLYTVPTFKKLMMDIITQGTSNIILSLDTLRSLDSTGLGALIGLRKALSEQKGSLVLICTAPHFRKIFSITGLERIFSFAANVREAYEEIVVGMQYVNATSC